MTNSNPSDLIFPAITKLRQLTQVEVQSNWRYISEDLSLDTIGEFPVPCSLFPVPFQSDCPLAQLNEKGYITWSAGHQVQWLAQQFTIPYDLQGYPLQGLALRLVLTWWAEDAQIFVNGKLVQAGDLFDSSARVLLTPSVMPHETILVVLRLVSPRHDIGGLMRSLLVYENEESFSIQNSAFSIPLDPGFVADELTVLYKYLEAFELEKLSLLEVAINQIDWAVVTDKTAFHGSLLNLRQTSQPLAVNLKQRRLNLLGHAHLDMAWLWTVDETWAVAQRTFTSVLNLQKDFSELTFCHTSPVLYQWIEKHRLDLFQDIQEAVKDKSWEVLGGMWVEPEVNLVSGESLVRQLLYGQRYIQEKFGAITQVAWLPDSFGFSWQLPQIFKESGIEYFVTGKLHWNDTNKFPHGIFWWQSPDGTQLLTMMSPPNVAGVMDTNPITMASYAVDWERQTGLKEAFWLPGVGDHGGGPSRDMLEVQQRWQKSPFFPQIQFTTAVDYLGNICQSLESNPESSLPVWNDELYLEFHRGCYTTHAEQKLFNRRCEDLLYQAELWSSLATIILGEDRYAYAKLQIEAAWKQVLFNQFHDILPGTSIPQVFVEANQSWQEVEEIGKEILESALNAIANYITFPCPPDSLAKPILIFNALNWSRSQVIALAIPARNWQIYDLEGQLLPSQLLADQQLLFLAKDIPSVGYRLFWLAPSNQPKGENSKAKTKPENFVLENELLRVIINPTTGDLDSIFDKVYQQEILQDKGNQLQAFQDKGQYWDAWNIDPNYEQHPLPPPQLKSIEYLEWGEIQWRIRVIRTLNQSEISQDYILQTNSPLLKIATTVNWQENQVLLKAAFPLNLASDWVTYEIPCATIQRSTCPQTPEQRAKWEVPALRWSDLSDITQNYGVSLLNDCKYGYDSQANQLRLTLLRSPQWPDPNSDRGFHQFTYAIYPHPGNWQAAKTVQRGYELNSPLQIIFCENKNENQVRHLPAVSKLLSWQADNLILMALKQSEDHPHQWILRCYESQGKEAELTLESDIGLALCHAVNLLEQHKETKLLIEPYKIVSFKLSWEN